jgi:DNA-binding SARP family transcriptional activator
MIVSISAPAPARLPLHVVEGPSDQDIAERAFSLFQARGGSFGQDLDDWLQAERELLHERSRQVGAVVIEEDPQRPLAEPAWP